jgi:hypothetical protein
VSRAVAVRSDAGPQAPHLGDEPLARHRFEILVHRYPLRRQLAERGGYAPKTTRVPVDGITTFLGMAWCTAMIVFRPEQWAGTM